MTKSKRHAVIETLERAFWQSMVDNTPETATRMLAPSALMVSGHGVTQFDHDGYTKMANDTRFKLLDFEISKMEVLFPTDDVAVATYHVHQKTEMDGKTIETDAIDSSTWVHAGGAWKCVIHTESVAQIPP